MMEVVMKMNMMVVLKMMLELVVDKEKREKSMAKDCRVRVCDCTNTFGDIEKAAKEVKTVKDVKGSNGL